MGPKEYTHVGTSRLKHHILYIIPGFISGDISVLMHEVFLEGD